MFHALPPEGGLRDSLGCLSLLFASNMLLQALPMLFSHQGDRSKVSQALEER